LKYSIHFHTTAWRCTHLYCTVYSTWRFDDKCCLFDWTTVVSQLETLNSSLANCINAVFESIRVNACLLRSNLRSAVHWG